MSYQLRQAEIPILPAGHAPIRILHFSDLHLTPARKTEIRDIKSFIDLAPDLIISTGDFLAHKFGVVKLLTWSGFIAGIGLTAGLFAGNIYGVIIGWLLLGVGISTVIPLMISATGTMANEKYSGQVSAAEGVALVTGVAYFGFVIGPPLIGFMSEIITLRWAMLLPAVLAIIFGLSAKKVLS